MGAGGRTYSVSTGRFRVRPSVVLWCRGVGGSVVDSGHWTYIRKDLFPWIGCGSGEFHPRFLVVVVVVTDP